MKPLILSFVLMFFFTGLYSQPDNIGAIVDPSWKSRVQEVGGAWQGNGDFLIKGSIYYHEDMHKGFITLSDGRSAKDVMLRFNLYTHEINYMEDKVEMILDGSAPVHEFGYSYTMYDDLKSVLFRSGYPTIGNKTSKTFYEVVVDTAFALLKYDTKKILEERTELGALQKSIIDSDTWYIFSSADNSISEIKKNKSSLLEALPKYASRINAIVDAKKLRLKSDADWFILLSELSRK